LPGGVLIRVPFAVAPLVVLLAGCDADLPDRGAPGAIVMAKRCSACHRVYAPGSMTLEMWKVQMARMQQLFAQRGIPWLSPDEEQAVWTYLQQHAGTQ
jgi:hypothetical protein